MNDICLLNDSFPPEIDGVANAVVNYATILQNKGYDTCVFAPENEHAENGYDDRFDFNVLRYPSIDLSKQTGYQMGLPFSATGMKLLNGIKPRIFHSHTPIMSNLLARGLREVLDVPLVMTYHSKFDIDIRSTVKGKLLQDGAIKALVDNISASDEVWTVSRGAADNLHSLGYEGECVVMHNGVDIPKGRLTISEALPLTSQIPFDENTPILLFVGRMMWYKGIRIILDALSALKYAQYNFRMVFIGGGLDKQEIEQYCHELNLDDRCTFIGPVYDRKATAAWYSRADLLLFPSTYDTNGLVVREAAACELATVMIDGSCAAEGVTHEKNALLIQQNAASLAVCIARVLNDSRFMRTLGINASNDLYISWEQAVDKAIQRYEVVIDRYNSNDYKRKRKLSDVPFKIESNFIEMTEYAKERMQVMKDLIDRYM